MEKALARSMSGTGEKVDFSGTWKNELNSEVTIVQGPGNAINGKYKSAVSDDGRQATGDLQGYIDGDLISFVVHWNDFQAITAWVGQLAPPSGIDTIHTLWQMTKQVAVGDEWASINAGSDTFWRK
ncbi:avidin/streptavidin family protein [Cupriavidus basilensis]